MKIWLVLEQNESHVVDAFYKKSDAKALRLQYPYPTKLIQIEVK